MIGDTSDEPLQVVALDDIPPRTRPHFEQDDAFAWRKPQLMMSAFGGVANVSDGTFGLYGLRFTLSLPMLDGTAQRRIIAAQEAARTRTLEATSQKNRVALLRMTATSTDQRIALLTKAVDVAKQREASVTRLVRAGVRTEGDVLDAMNDVARRESELLAVRVERWKLEQQLRWEQ